MRTIVLFDGQNLYHLAKNAWSSASDSLYTWPSYDVEKLARALVAMNPERILAEIRFYTGVHKRNVDPLWHGFWSNKLRYLRSRGIQAEIRITPTSPHCPPPINVIYFPETIVWACA